MGKAVMFHRDGKWHVGWILDRSFHATGDRNTVAWVEAGRMYSKVVEHVYPLDLPVELARNPK